jgi:hypothetical protein
MLGGRGCAVTEPELNPTTVAFRLKRAEHFAQAWRVHAKRLQALANNPRTPQLVRQEAITEAETAAGIVSQRAAEMAQMAKARGYPTWEADPKIGPLVVEIRAVESALQFIAEALRKQ